MPFSKINKGWARRERESKRENHSHLCTLVRSTKKNFFDNVICLNLGKFAQNIYVGGI